MMERIKRVMARTFDLPIADIGDDAEINSLPNWDSLGHMLLMLELEAEFGVSISSDDITNLLSLERLHEYLQAHGVDPGHEEPARKVKT